MSGSSDYEHVDVDEVVGESNLALRLRPKKGAAFWVPKSVVADAGDYKELS